MSLTFILWYVGIGFVFTLFSCYDMLNKKWNWDLQGGSGLAAVTIPWWIMWTLGILLAPLTIYNFFRSWFRYFRGYYPY